jgi:MtrB/PioB family decaheme-associated outer membrane protein
MERTRICFISALILALLFFTSSIARAQIDIGNFSVTGSAEIGGLPRHKTGNEAKFEEYRDLPETVIVPELELKIDSKKNDYYLEYDSTKVGRDDQNFSLRFGRHGLWDVEFEWDQIPHFFNGDTSATPFKARDGTFTLSSKPTTLGAPVPVNCTTPGAVCEWVNSDSHRINLNLLHGFARLKLRYTPTPGWTFNARYSSQNVNGDRAFDTITNGFTNNVELAEPIDYQIHNIELGGEYAAKWWSLGLKYNGSLFHNNTSTMVWDNPFNITGVGASCSDTASAPASGLGGTCRGRLDLYPSNQAHTFTLTGMAKLPVKTTFLGTVSYGWRLQDDNFLPFTINPAIGPLAAGGALPSSRDSLLRKSLDGDVRPTMVNATLVNRYFDRLDLKAYYRYYDLDNQSKRLFLPDGYIRTDTGPSASAAADDLRSFPYAYSKQNMGLDATYNVTRWLSGKLSYGWERMHRERREVLDSNEHSFGPTIDLKPWSWLLIRASYRRYLRDAHNYDAGREIVYETGETRDEIRENRLEALRKFDEAARKRNKVGLFTQISPFENLTLHGGFDFTSDDYPQSEIGTQKDINYSPSVGFVYAPVAWANLFGDYNWDRFDWRMKAMQRNSDLQTPEANPDRVWTSRGKERIHTISLGTDLKLIENLLGLRLQYGFSYGESLVHASGSTCAGCTRATDYPSVTNRWHELLARFEYAVHKNVDLKFGYYFNRFSSKDFGVDIMKLWMGDVDSGAANSIFLGDRLKGDYTAHVGFIALRLKF